MAKLVMKTGKHAGKSYDLEGSTILGRGEDVQVRVADAKASREHCRVFEQAGGWVVADLNSRNGITINGVKKTRHNLKNGDRIAIGQTVVVFQGDAPAADPARSAAAPSKAKRDKRKEAAFAKARADASRSRSAPARASSGGSPSGGGGAEISDRVLQFNKVEGKSPLSIDLSQASGLTKFVLFLGGALVVGGIVVGGLKILDTMGD